MLDTIKCFTDIYFHWYYKIEGGREEAGRETEREFYYSKSADEKMETQKGSVS